MRIFNDGLENRSQLMLRQATKAAGLRFGNTDAPAASAEGKADTFTRTTPVTMAFDPRIETRFKHHSVDEMAQQTGAVMSLMGQELAADNIAGTQHKTNGFNTDEFVVRTKSGAVYTISNNVANGGPEQLGYLSISRGIRPADPNSFEEMRQQIKVVYGLNGGKPDLNSWQSLAYSEDTYNRPNGIGGGIQRRDSSISLTSQNLYDGAQAANTMYVESELRGLLTNALASLVPADDSGARSLLDPTRKWRYHKPEPLTPHTSHAGLDG